MKEDIINTSNNRMEENMDMKKLRRLPYAHVVSTENGYIFFNRLVNVPIEFPRYGTDEVVIQPSVIAVCGSDVHAHDQDSGTHPFAKHPLSNGEKGFIPFHEGVGIIKAVGSNVKSLKIGDRVAIESTIFSDDCPPGRWSQSEKMKIVGLGTDGLGSELAVLPGKVAVRISKGVSDELGAQFEPLGVSVHAWMRAMNVYETTTKKDAREAWFMINGGTGSVGGLALTSLIAEGVPEEHIIATGTTPAKLEALKEKYPKLNVFNLTDKTQTQEILEQVTPRLELEGFGGKIPIVIEATGHDPRPIFPFVGKGTVFVVVGLSSDLQQGENLMDNNNFVVRSQRTILTFGNKKDEQLIKTAKAIFEKTVTKEREPKILTIDSSTDIPNLLAERDYFDIVINRTGSFPEDIDKLLKKGGIWITQPIKGNSPLPTQELLEREVILVGSWGRDKEDWDVMASQVREGRLSADKLPITLFEFSEEGLNSAFENVRKGKVGFKMGRRAEKYVN
ncbi:hypothetical protein COS80_01965 [Candidatus Woesebacteria bacterium CG06_land_8_20_14_3_00_39_27]|uniref:Alcohol dehydrogenase-like N-terminal domain-containing protein n=1 Tax=Candidatus Woesebacteria bacterium CG06_land_8_20_14_3_00_39_27 TaxID=1975057 RepID=A0A2M7AQ37_9BACT|nr:MAG: hypothetical protein COS80_01965 [Candidatus Woesebacteria bacterium CG06_land_8_20_14_3_00_39_27]